MPDEKTILIIIEGEKTEKQIFVNIEKIFFNYDERKRADVIPIVLLPAKQNIYMLWEKLKDDEYLDVIELLREQDDEAAKILELYERDNIAETYLFFDYDSQHLNKADKEKYYQAIPDMLQIFSDETDLGKLYINYPMVESLRDMDNSGNCEMHCVVKLDEISNYKNIVGSITAFHDARKYDYTIWQLFCQRAARRADCLVNNKKPGCCHGIQEISSVEVENFPKAYTQDVLYESELCNYTCNGEVLVLCSIPLFLLDYFPGSVRRKLLG